MIPLTLSNHCARPLSISRFLGWGAWPSPRSADDDRLVGGFPFYSWRQFRRLLRRGRRRWLRHGKNARRRASPHRKLVADGTDDPLAAYDLAVILTWVNRPREATEAFERGSAVEVPDYVLAPIVRAYSDQKRFAEAERWAREGEWRFPIDSTWPKLLGLAADSTLLSRYKWWPRSSFRETGALPYLVH